MIYLLTAIRLTAGGSGDRGSTVVKVLCYKIARPLVRSQLVSLEFFIHISHYGPGVDSASNRNE